MAAMAHSLIALLVLCLWFSGTFGFYIPGVSPVEFKVGSTVEVKAVKLTSTKIQLPYDYYSLAFCRPDGILRYKAENLGEILRGDRIVNTPYVLRFKVGEQCRLLCSDGHQKKTLSIDESNLMIQRIEEDYRVHLLVDNLPCATGLFSQSENEQFAYGYPLGRVTNGQVFVNNHLTFVIHTNDVGNDRYRIVGFEVQAYRLVLAFLGSLEDNIPLRSVDSASYSNARNVCSINANSNAQVLTAGEENSLFWSYSVVWKDSDVHWANRWDAYLILRNAKIHWLSITNSALTVVILAGFLFVIIIRVVRKDIANYNRLQESDDALEESGWKLIHGDVFRPPPKATLLVAVVGSGIQVFGMALTTIGMAMMGMLSPSSRGSLMSVALFLYCFMGIFSGYFAGRMYKTFRLRDWKKAAFQTACLFPSFLFGVGFILNVMMWRENSSGTVSASSMFSLLSMFLCIDVPLVMIAFQFGFRKQPYSNPVRTNQIPRQVPEQPFHVNLCISMVIGGVLPFLAMFLELALIFAAVWQNQFYYLFGFLFIVFIILMLSSSLITVLSVYFLLSAENYHWWWRSFFIGSSSALYVFMYSIYYYFTKLDIVGLTPSIFYFSSVTLICITLWLLTGTIGFYASFLFVRKIYSAVKID